MIPFNNIGVYALVFLIAMLTKIAQKQKQTIRPIVVGLWPTIQCTWQSKTPPWQELPSVFPEDQGSVFDACTGSPWHASLEDWMEKRMNYNNLKINHFKKAQNTVT